MGAPDSIPKFFDLPRPPINGGWHYWLDEGKSFPVNGGTPEQVHAQVKLYRSNNRLPNSDDETIWRELWAYWCSREPERCHIKRGKAVDPEKLPGKEVWGPIIWRFLNWAAVNYSGAFFTMLVNETRQRLVICPDCRRHFEELLVRHPLSQVRDAKTACIWIHTVHNAVNRSIGKPEFSYEDFVQHYGAPRL